ncbi:MAG: SDR family NAD(P)-dependent oxidoreductase [Nitrososphaerales archaeon]
MSEQKKIVLITGASSGFGEVTANLLLENRYRVFGTSRNPSKKNSKFEMLILDVNSDESVDYCVKSLLEKTGGRLDVLVNNAGYVQTGALEEASIEDAKAQFETNFFGIVRMNNAVLPTMRKQKSGLIINVSSMACSLPVPFEGYYAASKFAVEGYSEVLRMEVKNLGIRVSMAEPGFFKTGIDAARKTASKNIEDYKVARDRTVRVLVEHVKAGGDPKDVALEILRIIQSNSPKLRNFVGREKRYITLKKIVPASMFESSMRKHWKLDG